MASQFVVPQFVACQLAESRSGSPMKFSVVGTERDVALDAVIIAGYTGRDRDAVMHHIDELAALGVPPPPTVPMYWMLPGWIATQQPLTTATGAGSSGEAEMCLIVDGAPQDGGPIDPANVFVTIASDHTDREAEAVDIGLSKAICQKPMGVDAWPLADVAGRWDELVLRSWIDDGNGEVAYQHGPCSTLVPPTDLLAGVPFDPRPQRFALLCGTVPVIGGIRPSGWFRGELHDPKLRRSIEFQYEVRALTPARPKAGDE
ncbi:MAG TPA: DUF2848 family protein [Ilumatobacteraceae bacterium]|nr:DUF2848 family protein [Ilumatobacteraceae bacterium]